MFTASTSIPADCTKDQYLTILEELEFTHSEPEIIESIDLPMIRGKTVKINTDKRRIVISYSVPTPDLV